MDAKEAIKKMLKSRGLTQTEVAEKIGRKQSNVAMYICKAETMRLENLKTLADACGYDVMLVDRRDLRNAISLSDSDGEYEGQGDYTKMIRDLIADELRKRGIE